MHSALSAKPCWPVHVCIEQASESYLLSQANPTCCLFGEMQLLKRELFPLIQIFAATKTERSSSNRGLGWPP